MSVDSEPLGAMLYGDRMIVGTGIDIAEVDRIRQTVERFGRRFTERVFTADEIRYCESKANKIERYAARFAAKEAAWPSVGLVGSLAINLGFLMLCWAAIAMAIGCACRRRGSAGAIAGLLALTAYLTDYIGRAWKPAESVAWLSPFRYYTPFELVMGSAVSAKSLYVLGGIAAAAFALAYLLYSRRDISH